MATLINTGSGNFSDPNTWDIVDPTSFLDTRASTATIATSPGASNTFIPGAITVQGVAVQLSSRSATPTGTFTVQLYNSTTATNVTSSVVNVADIPNTAGTIANLGWTYFKFASPQNLTAGQSYSVRLSTSVGSMIGCYVSAGTNYSRALVTTSSASPVATDTIIIVGEYISAGVSNDRTVTMDNSGSITYYRTTYIGAKGKLSYGTNPNTNYSFGLSGSLLVTYSGSLEIGTAANPIPSSSTATLEISCSQSGSAIISCAGGTITTYGSAVTHSALLNADVAVAATSSITNVATGWKSGSVICVPSTTRTYTQFETITLKADAVGTSLPSHSAYTFAHGGNAATYVQADIGNLTRNITIKSTVGSLRTNLAIADRSNVSINYTAFQDIGYATSVLTAGVTIAGFNAGSVNFQYNVFTAPGGGGSTTFYNSNGATTTPTPFTTISNNIFYNLAAPNGGTAVSSGHYNDNNLFIAGGNFTIIAGCLIGSNNVIASSGNNGFQGQFLSGSTGNKIYASNNGGYSNNNSSISFSTSDLRIWRNATGMTLSATGNSRESFFNFSNVYMFGNTSTNLSLSNPSFLKVAFNNSYFWGGTTSVSPYGFGGGGDTVYFNSCSFGLLPDNTTVSLFTNSAILAGPNYTNFYNCRFTGSEATVTTTGGVPDNYGLGVVSMKHNGVDGAYKIFGRNGTVQTDTVRVATNSPSLRLIPSTAAFKTYSPYIRIPVISGSTCTVSVKVRRSTVASGDAANYNGTAPRLMYAYNPQAGNLTDELVAATSTAASSGSFETLSYTTPTILNTSVLRFYVDCDGTTGFVNVDDWSTTTFNNTKNLNFSGTTGTYVEVDYREPGGNYTFIR